MLALDANPDVAKAARVAGITARVGTTTLQAEDATHDRWRAASYPGTTAGRASRSTAGRATSPWATGRPPRCPCPAPMWAALVLPVVDLMPGSTAVTTWSAGGTALGRVASGDIGAQGVSPAPGALLPVTLPRTLGRTRRTLRVTTSVAGGDEARLDAVMLEPLVSRYVLAGDGTRQRCCAVPTARSRTPWSGCRVAAARWSRCTTPRRGC